MYNIIIKHKCYRKKIETLNKLDLPMGSRWTEKHIEDEFANLAFLFILQENKNKYETWGLLGALLVEGVVQRRNRLIEMVGADASGEGTEAMLQGGRRRHSRQRNQPRSTRGWRLRIPGARQRVEVGASGCSSMAKSLNLACTSSRTYWFSTT